MRCEHARWRVCGAEPADNRTGFVARSNRPELGHYASIRCIKIAFDTFGISHRQRAAFEASDEGVQSSSMDDPMDDEARKLAADQSAEAIREAYAREQAAAANDKAAPLVQGVDDEWADWRGCVCGGSYYGEMVACEGG